MIDFAAVLAIAGFTLFGWMRGVKGMALWALSLVAGSLVAAFLARPAGLWLASVSGLPILAALPIAGIVLVALVTGLARSASRKVGRQRKFMAKEGWEPPVWDRWGGAGIGTVSGVGVVLFVAWVGNATGNVHGRKEQLRASVVGRAAANVGEPVVRVVAGEMVGSAVMASTAAFLMSDPEKARETLAPLVVDPRVRGLAGDPGVRQALAEGNAGALSRVPALRQLSEDPAFVTAARRLRISPDGNDATVTPQALAEALSGQVGPLAQAVDALSRNPEVQAALGDPDFQAALARGDVAALLSQGKLDVLVQNLLHELEGRR